RFLGLHVAPPGRQLPKCDLSVDCCALIRKSISGQRSTNNSHLRRSCVPLTLVHGAFPPRTEANQQLGVPRIVTFKQLPKPPGRKSAQETHFVFRSRKCAIGVSSRNL